MAEQPKKPRNIKDLKAKLGRTVAPGGGAAAPVPAPTGAPAPSSVAPPPAGAPVVAPPQVTAPPKMAAPAPFLGAPSAPSFLQNSVPPPAPQPMQDPFAAGPAMSGPQEVRLVIDEKPVDDAEVGRRSRGRNFILVGVGILLGALVGAGGASLNNQNLTWNLAVRSGKEIYRGVMGATERVERAKVLLDRAANAANGGPGKAPEVDYAAIEELASLERPFTADQFSRKNYNLFRASTVDDVFVYYNAVSQLWTKFESLNARTRSEARRTELNEASRATSDLITTPAGCVPAVAEDRMVCNLVFVTLPTERPEGDEPTKVRVSTRPGAAQSAEKVLYTNQDITQEPGQYVIPVNVVESVGVLGQRATPFAEFKRDLNALQQLMQQTMEVQGRLQSALGEIAAYNTRFAIGDPGDTPEAAPAGGGAAAASP